MKNITTLVIIQCSVTKYIVVDCTLNYKERLHSLSLLPFIYIHVLELNDILFPFLVLKIQPLFSSHEPVLIVQFQNPL